MAAKVDVASNDVLRYLGNVCGSHRAYVFHFRGSNMSNTHEWVSPGTASFKEKLSHLNTNELPFFVSRMQVREPVVVGSVADLDAEEAKLERAEMTEEKIRRLALVPIPASGLPDAKSIGGFIGVDFCDAGASPEDKAWQEAERAELVSTLSEFGAFLFKVQALYELSGGVSPIEYERTTTKSEQVISRASNYGRERLMERIVQDIQRRHARLFARFTPHCMAAMPSKVPKQLLTNSAHPSITEAQLNAQKHFFQHRYALLPPNLWLSDTCTKENLAELRGVLLRNLENMDPDIAPYSEFRNVGYARYRYRNGTIFGLKHKKYFQIDPRVNVLLHSKPRPFARLTDDLRANQTLAHMLQVLLERVWNSDLGPDVHINVHPVRVRNFHEGEILAKAHATLEGTHTDSTYRVAVVFIGRHNVKVGTAKTALYHKSAPMGKRRDLPEDEAILAPLRVAEVELQEPFQAISFDDNNFKHDASDPQPEDPKAEMWRCVMLIMCRVPCNSVSPVDGRAIDGYTPRSPRAQTHL